MVDLIQEGLQAADNERRLFFDLADRLSVSADPDERRRLKAALARMTFGE